MTMLKCNEVSRLAASGEIARASILRRLEFRLHLMMCRHCRDYVRQVGLIGAAARRLLGTTTRDAEIVAHLESEVLKAVRRPGEPRSYGGPNHPPVN